MNANRLADLTDIEIELAGVDPANVERVEILKRAVCSWDTMIEAIYDGTLEKFEEARIEWQDIVKEHGIIINANINTIQIKIFGKTQCIKIDGKVDQNDTIDTIYVSAIKYAYNKKDSVEKYSIARLQLLRQLKRIREQYKGIQLKLQHSRLSITHGGAGTRKDYTNTRKEDVGQFINGWRLGKVGGDFWQFTENKHNAAYLNPAHGKDIQPDTAHEAQKEEMIKKLLLERKNIILYGPPGTGKTYNTVNYAVAILLDEQELRDVKKDYGKAMERYRAFKSAGRIAFTTFHQSFSYEDFIEGIRPVLANEATDTSDTVQYKIRPGIFREICRRAEADPNNKYALIIDEINRGNISKIFGELITLIEENKRWGASEQMEVTLPYSGGPLRVPPNVYIIGTMNTADRSLAFLDTALRRRFAFIPVYPDSLLLKDKSIEGIELEKLLDAMNTRISNLYDKEHCIGHSYFLKIKNFKQLKYTFKNDILPLLEEYFFERHEYIHLVLGSAPFLKQKSIDPFLKNKGIDVSQQWEIDTNAFGDPENYKKIYKGSSPQPSETPSSEHS